VIPRPRASSFAASDLKFDYSADPFGLSFPSPLTR
jgi:hypothetical protein